MGKAGVAVDERKELAKVLYVTCIERTYSPEGHALAWADACAKAAIELSHTFFEAWDNDVPKTLPMERAPHGKNKRSARSDRKN